MAGQYALDCDEVVLLKESCVAHGGVMAIYTDELVLTNKRIICLHRGMFGGVKTTYVYPLDQLKLYNGVPQAQKGKLSNGLECLDLYFLNSVEHFNFQAHNTETINQWILEIKKVFGLSVDDAKPQSIREKAQVRVDDDSVLGAFKKVGNVFVGVGKEFASAFGVRFKDKTSTNVEVDDEDALDYKHKLENDEVILLPNGSVGLSGDIDNIPDVVQKTQENTCTHCGALIDTGLAFCTACGARIGVKSSGEQIEKEYVCKQCGNVVPDGQNFCTECGTPIERQKESEEEITNQEATKSDTPNSPAQTMSIEQQVELLQKLKSLVDSGVISQEEFEKMKREIL